ncbi:MAG TPA: SDR family oxidoreductase [Bacteroidia bacterium]|nr:SDR family oxidoreductase [Bacteroidia bacterium]
MKTLENKVTIVTGAGSGMGKAIAMLFASEGASVVCADLNETNLNSVISEIEAKNGKAAKVIVNVSKPEDCKRMIETALNQYGGLDVLVNNAGIMDDFIPVGDVTDDVWNKVIGVNLNGVFYASREAVQVMLKRGKGSIVNIASVGGLYGSRAGAAYTASKHAVVGLTKNTGYMYAKSGIRCNAIAPGGVNTNIGASMKPNPFGAERMNLGAASMPRMGEPSEIAELALFLASDKSSFINGSIVTADAGWTAY